MKYTASLFLIFSFIAVAVFGFLVFDHAMGSMDGGCIATAIDGVACPMNVVAFISHHVSAFKTFSNALTGPILGLLFLIAAVSASLFYRRLLHLKHRFRSQRLCHSQFDFHNSQKRFTHWLALLEHSPSY